MLSLACIFLVGILDYITGYEVSFSVFYLIPILISSINTGFLPALLVSFLSAASWLTADLLWQRAYSHWFIPYWNAAVRLSFFITIAYLSAKLMKELSKEKFLSRTDSTTDIANSRHFIEMLNLEIFGMARHGRPFTLLYIDADNFKQVNDAFGHKRGDELLRSIASIIRQNVRNTDLPARIGGDEFCVIMPETDANSAKSAADKLHVFMTKSMTENNYTVSFSIGAVTFLKIPDSAEQALKEADNTMYIAKKTGKNRIEYKTIT